MALSIRQHFHLPHAAIGVQAHGVADQLELADHLVDHHVAERAARALGHLHGPMCRASGHAARAQCLQLSGVECDVSLFECIGFGEHQAPRLLGREVFDCKRAGRRQRGQRDRGQHHAHQKLQPSPRLMRLLSLAT